MLKNKLSKFLVSVFALAVVFGALVFVSSGKVLADGDDGYIPDGFVLDEEDGWYKKKIDGRNCKLLNQVIINTRCGGGLPCEGSYVAGVSDDYFVAEDLVITKGISIDDGYSLNIYLNGKKNNIFIARGCILYYYKYSKKNVFLLVERSLYGGHEILVYKFSGNTIKQVQELKTSCFSAPNIKSASGKKLTIILSPYHNNQIKCLKNYNLPNWRNVEFKKIYKISTSAHKFKSSSNFVKPVKAYPLYYYGSGTYATSSDSLKDNGKGVKLKYGKKYTLKQARIVPYTQNGFKMDYARFQVADSKGNTGWFDSREDLNFYYSKQ